MFALGIRIRSNGPQEEIGQAELEIEKIRKWVMTRKSYEYHHYLAEKDCSAQNFKLGDLKFENFQPLSFILGEPFFLADDYEFSGEISQIFTAKIQKKSVAKFASTMVTGQMRR